MVGLELRETYNSWRGMRERCYSKKHVSYQNYGGRGIKVCDTWKNDFYAFFNDMGKKPKNTSLDRIDNNGDYSPKNCRWADQKTQVQNSRQFLLPEEKIDAIRNALKSGARQIDIAVMCGVSRSHIANIATGHSRSGY
jgi:hypothetical protein